MDSVKSLVFLDTPTAATLETFFKESQDSIQVECFFKSMTSGLPYTLTSSAISAQDQSSTDVTSSLIGGIVTDYSNGGVKFQLKGGVDRGRYIVFCDVVSAENVNYRGAFRVRVRDLTA